MDNGHITLQLALPNLVCRFFPSSGPQLGVIRDDKSQNLDPRNHFVVVCQVQMLVFTLVLRDHAAFDETSPWFSLPKTHVQDFGSPTCVIPTHAVIPVNPYMDKSSCVSLTLGRVEAGSNNSSGTMAYSAQPLTRLLLVAMTRAAETLRRASPVSTEGRYNLVSE